MTKYHGFFMAVPKIFTICKGDIMVNSRIKKATTRGQHHRGSDGPKTVRTINGVAVERRGPDLVDFSWRVAFLVQTHHGIF
jgi:hypothetical protein